MRLGVDVFHGTDFSVPYLRQKPAVMTVHDLSPWLDPAWQPATEELFQSARRVEKLLAVMFGAAAGDSAEDQLPAQLLSSLAQLRAKVEGYDRISANTER